MNGWDRRKEQCVTIIWIGEKFGVPKDVIKLICASIPLVVRTSQNFDRFWKKHKVSEPSTTSYNLVGVKGDKTHPAHYLWKYRWKSVCPIEFVACSKCLRPSYDNLDNNTCECFEHGIVATAKWDGQPLDELFVVFYSQ